MKKLYTAVLRLGHRLVTSNDYRRWYTEETRLVWAMHEEEARQLINAVYVSGDATSMQEGAYAHWIVSARFVETLGDPA